MRPDQVALQLYTVRDLIARDLEGTLRAVASAGYRFVEIAGIPDRLADSLPGALRHAGLTAIAAHVGFDRLRAGTSNAAVALEAIGCPRAIVPSLPEANRRTPEDVAAFAREMNDVATALSERGIRLGYHNHSFEFAPLDGTTVWDVLLDELDPAVELELDVYWASVGGRDPAAEIRRAADRIGLLHMKDRRAGSDPRDAPAGEGILDMASIVAAGREANVDWYIAEQDEPGDVLADIAVARRNLLSLAG